jgi:SRSO17 transposase
VLVIDDTAIPKKGTHSVGVAAQYVSALGKTANCQTLISLTLARGEVPVMLALRLFQKTTRGRSQDRSVTIGCIGVGGFSNNTFAGQGAGGGG